MQYEIITGTCESVLPLLAKSRGAFAKIVLTSPPYYGKRLYEGGQTDLNSPDSLVFRRAHTQLWRDLVYPIVDAAGALVVNHDDSISATRRPGETLQNSAGSTERRAHRDGIQLQGKQTPKTMMDGSWMLIPEQIAAACSDNRAYAALWLESLSPEEIKTLLATRAPWVLAEKIVWSKPNAAPESQRRRHKHSYELIHVMRKYPSGGYFDYEYAREPAVTAKKEIELGRDGKRLKRDVFEQAIQPSKYGHPAMMPAKLIRDLILTYSAEGDWIVDPFCGSGTTGEMALELGRNFVGIEISERWANVARQRLARHQAQLLSVA